MFFLFRKKPCIHAPGDRVLKGITRQKVFDLCNQLNYKIIEKSISINSLHKLKLLFLQELHPKILPIRRIANIQYDVANPVVKTLMIRAYDDLIASYIFQW